MDGPFFFIGRNGPGSWDYLAPFIGRAHALVLGFAAILAPAGAYLDAIQSAHAGVLVKTIHRTSTLELHYQYGRIEASLFSQWMG